MLSTAFFVGFIYFIVKFFEAKASTEATFVFKKAFRDSVLVTVSTMLALFLLDQIEPLASGIPSAPAVFTNEPDF